MQTERVRIVFAGGGTGGHVFPALAIADAIKAMNADAALTFIGTREKIEARIVPEHGYAFESIWISGFRRKLTVGNILFPLKVVVALVQSLLLMKRIRPHVVVGTGGYVCGPPLFVATLLGIPALIQEQNSYPGITTRLLASRVDQVHVSFEVTRQFLKRDDNVRLSGNPTRERVGTVAREEGARFFSIDPSRRTVLVFGGSLGAHSINMAMRKSVSRLVEKGVQMVWQTGKADYGAIAEEVDRLNAAHLVKVYAFIDNMEYAYAACDLAVCRSGATTVAELAKAGVPSVLVPYPFAAADHQTENARAMVNAGAAIMIPDADLETALLRTIELVLADAAGLQTMRTKVLTMANPEAARVIARSALDLAKAEYGRA